MQQTGLHLQELTDLNDDIVESLSPHNACGPEYYFLKMTPYDIKRCWKPGSADRITQRQLYGRFY